MADEMHDSHSRDEVAGYRFLKRINAGSLFDSWIAQDLESNRKVFLKCPAEKAGKRSELAQERLRESYDVLQVLRHPNILPPIGSYESQSLTFTAFPYIPQTHQLRLTPEKFAALYPSLLTKFCHVIDYIHCLGFVHCDIKLSNFLLVEDSHGYQLYLTDFDFITKLGSSLGKRVLGTPHHIAPEILRNEVVLPQSDHFSFGIMLLKLVSKNASALTSELIDQLRGGLVQVSLTESEIEPTFVPLVPFINTLLNLNAAERPTYLGEVLRSLAPVQHDHTGIECYDERLIKAIFKAKYRAVISSRGNNNAPVLESVVDDMKLVGIPPEILKDAECGLPASYHSVARSLYQLLGDSEISRVGDHWHVQPKRMAISKFYQSRWLPREFRDVLLDKFEKSWQQKLLLALRFKVSKEFLKSLCLIEDVLSLPSHEPVELAKGFRSSLLVKAGQLYRACGQVGTAHDCYNKALATGKLPARKRVSVLCDLADMNWKEQKGRYYRQVLHEAWQLARHHNLHRDRLRILHKRLWIYYAMGQPTRALGRLKAIERIAKTAGYVDFYSRTCNLVGLVYRAVGRLEDAKEVFREGVRFLERSGSLKKPVALYNNLAYTYFDLGTYPDCIESAETALKLNSDSTDTMKNTFAYFALASCYTLLGRYDLADLNLTKLLNTEVRAGHIAGIAAYYLQRGWSNLRRSNTDAAFADLTSALRMSSTLENDGHKGKALLYLAMLYHWRGNYEQALSAAKEAHEIFERVGDRVLAVEARLLLLQISAPEVETLDIDQVVEVLDESVAMHNYLGASKCLFCLTASGEEKEALAYLERQSDLKDYLLADATPFTLATRYLVDYWLLSAGQRDGEAISKLKQSYLSLRRASLLFDAITVSDLIASHYARGENHRLATKFLEESLYLARCLSNLAISKRLEKRLTSVRRQDAKGSIKLKALFEISNLLNSLSEYKEVQAEILKYAIRVTGAERGALLIADSGGNRLRVDASYDCDDQSISDIKSISRNVIDSVYGNGEPCLVEDATKNETTREYKSVIQHNILSVACIPLLTRDELVGALYLDHHVLSGLFSSEDYEMIKAVGNFAAIALDHARHVRRLESENIESIRTLQAHGIKTPFISQDPHVIDLLQKLPLIANSTSSVLLVGESGTGKELLADMIHQQSGRSEAPFVKLNCASLGGSMLESELFGVEKGAATGVLPRGGKFEAADGGTLLLDEIGAMPLPTQAKVLRVLENQEFERLGSNRCVSVDVRLISATNQDLQKLIADKQFREDLYYRINTVELKIPPLRERADDIMKLIDHFLSVFGGKKRYTFSPEAKALLTSYIWPGNVRELRNFAERLTLLIPPGIIGIEDLPGDFSRSQESRNVNYIQRKAHEIEKSEINKLLRELNWNQSAVARKLGMPLSTLRRRLKKYRISKEF